MTDPPTQTASDICRCQLCARSYHIIKETEKALGHARVTTHFSIMLQDEIVRSWLASYGTSIGYYVKEKKLKVF